MFNWKILLLQHVSHVRDAMGSKDLLLDVFSISQWHQWELIWFNGISTLDGYLMPNPVYTHTHTHTHIYIYIYKNKNEESRKTE